jgi:hypothetical protein
MSGLVSDRERHVPVISRVGRFPGKNSRTRRKKRGEMISQSVGGHGPEMKVRGPKAGKKSNESG